MNTALAAAILALVETAIEQEPKIQESLKSIFAKSNPTPADWQAERNALASEPYETVVPHTQLTGPPLQQSQP
jgi:hypothetical protein